MTADLYLTVFVLGAGAGIGAFWSYALAARKVDTFGDFGSSRAGHVAAELATAAIAIAAGLARIVDERSGPAVVLTAAALGMIAYAVLQSPGYYRARAPALVWVLAATGIADAVAIALLLART